MVVKERVRTGGRSARIQAAVHDAVKDLSAETDRAELSVPMIAARAGVTPSTIYRRWGDLSELLSDVAVERLRPVAGPMDTGAVETDLAVWIEQYMEEMSSEVGRTMLRDLVAGSADAGNLCQCFAFTYDQLRAISDRAVKRGEAPFDVDEVVDHVVAPIMYHILFSGRELTLPYCHGLLERIRAVRTLATLD